MFQIQTLIYIHAFLGGIALVSGGIAASTKKGSKIHKRTGAIFHHSMLVSIFISLIIAVLPSHFNPFLFSIGLFSAYFTIIGKRCLQSHMPLYNIEIDRYLAKLMIGLGVIMNLIPFILNQNLGIVLHVFGLAAIIVGYSDMKKYRDVIKYQKDRILNHISRISGGYIAALTAFLVVNNVFSGYIGWFLPSVLGSIYIFYWVNVNKKDIKNQ